MRTFSKGRWALLTAAGIAATVIAFYWGDFLLGPATGIAYAAIALAIAWLAARSRTADGHVSTVKLVAVAAFALPVACFMASPASFSPDTQHFIENHAIARSARKEIDAVLQFEPAFSNLHLRISEVKVVSAAIAGSVATRADFERLRSRIREACPAAAKCWLLWDLEVRDTGQRVSGADDQLSWNDK